jgi:RNA recognition motif-containing protein
MRLFVANIAFTTTEDELERLFAPYGSVDRVQIITDRDTGRSRGFAFVEMPDATQAQAAIAGLNWLRVFAFPFSTLPYGLLIFGPLCAGLAAVG